ncbi:hypothetical protein ACP3VW_05900 [Vibrio sp. DNB22_17_1]
MMEAKNTKPINEKAIVRHALLSNDRINRDLLSAQFGIAHLHDHISDLSEEYPIERRWISRPHPATGKLRNIREYWLCDEVRHALVNAPEDEALKRNAINQKVKGKHKRLIAQIDDALKYWPAKTLVRMVQLRAKEKAQS